MKRLTFLILLAIITPIIFNLEISYANAEIGEKYMRVINYTTPFYSDNTGNNLLFYLPYTYYVKVLESAGEYYHVECSATGLTAIDGYVPRELLYYDGLEVRSPYPTIELTASNSTALFSDYILSTNSQYIFPARTMKFYGSLKATDGSNIYYVSYNNKLGYVREEDVMPFTLTNHPNELTFIKPEPEDVEPVIDVDNTNDNPIDKGVLDLRIVIIICLSLAGIVAIFVSINSKGKGNTATTYYDEDYP